MRPDKSLARSKNVIRPEYRKESIADENTRDILDQIVSCERYGPPKITKKGHASDTEKARLELRKDEIRDFIVRRLKEKEIPHERIIDLMSAEGRSWKNFSRVGKVQGENIKGELIYRNVSTAVTTAAFCAAAQLTNTPLENLIVGFLEYCDGDDNRAGISIPELIPHRDAVERLKREVREARSGRHRANSPEPASDDSETYKDRLGRRIRGADKWLDAYNHDELPFVGRDDEQKRLDEFIKCSGPFKIWAIIAPAGAGKTRLMFQWVDTSPALEGWDCRKLEARDIDKPEEWLEWSPDHPTLLIVDYMFGYEKVFEELVRRGHYFDKHHENNPRLLVRLLVIDHHMVLKRKANVRVKDNFGRTALMLAAHLGKTEIAKLLLEQNILTRDDKDNYERTALMYSVIGGHAEMVSMLLRWDADVYVRDDKGFTVLIVACARGYSEIVALLLKPSIDTLDRKDNYGRTALMYASALGHLEIVEKLVEASADIHVKDDIGITALMLAQAAGHTEVVEVLLGKAKTDVF